MDRYSKGVIVERVETSQEWAMVQRSDAVAAQGYYLSRPTSFDGLQALRCCFAANSPLGDNDRLSSSPACLTGSNGITGFQLSK